MTDENIETHLENSDKKRPIETQKHPVGVSYNNILTELADIENMYVTVWPKTGRYGEYGGRVN